MWTEQTAADPRARSPFRTRLWALTAIILAGAALRTSLLTGFRFHPDEALFATLGRLIISGQDPLLRNTSLLVDKPPLFYYLLAGGISLGWGSELAARLPGLFASILSLALAARLAWRLWRSNLAAVGAAMLIALSPFAIQFSATVFADPIMVMGILAALVAVSEGHWMWAGVLIGCAVAIKQSGLIFLPLVVAVGLVQRLSLRQRTLDSLRWLAEWAAGFALVLMIVAVWVRTRGAPVTFWQAGVAANDPGRIVRVGEVWSRLLGWGNWLGYATASPWLNVIVVSWIISATSLLLKWNPLRRSTTSTLVVLLFISSYLGLIWLVAFPLLDRYLLPVIVLGLMLTAGLAGGVIKTGRFRRIVMIGSVLVVAGMIPQALKAARGAFPIGGDHGQFDGITEAAVVLNDLPVGSVVYYTSLGWPLTYYLLDASVYLASIDSGAALGNDLAAFARNDPATMRMLILPGWVSQEEIIYPAEQAGYVFERVRATFSRQGERSIVIYRILKER